MRTGFVGWRGMVGSVLRERMTQEGDWAGLDTTFFSTSNAGGRAPDVGQSALTLAGAADLDALGDQEVIITCQGGQWTKDIHGRLRERGWDGYWVDAASALRMEPRSIIVLDPLNRDAIVDGLNRGVRDFIGGNCTVSLLLMGLGGLMQRGWVQWISTMTYQAASGAGARQMTELVAQMRDLGEVAGGALDDPAASALSLERLVTTRLRDGDHPSDRIGYPLAGNLLPWIDRKLEDGRTREEWKGAVESDRILGLQPPVPIDGLCVRVGALRCHSQAVTIALDEPRPLEELEAAIASTSPWTEVVPNDPESTLARLTPAAVTGTLRIPVGRLRRMHTAPNHVAAFTVGDQLLWGAAEPLRRMLVILREHRSAVGTTAE